MENLQTLVTLRELDLSFNKISKIENLETLVNLEKLSFYENLIETIENMENLKKLSVFSIGKNKISDWENIHYLRKFSKLSSLNMAHNPCAEEDNFRVFIAAFLPKLVYYEYIRLEEAEREEGIELFERQLNNLQKIEDEENAKVAIIEKERADAEVHSLSFVEYLNTRHLFDEMFQEDIEGKALLEIGEEVKEFYVEYEEQFIHFCKQVFQVGQKHYVVRKEEVDQFLNTVESAKKQNQEESIEHMERFMERKGTIFQEIRYLQHQLDNERIEELEYNDTIDMYAEEFTGLIHDTWKKLMKMELQLYEQVDEVNQNFGHTLNDLINGFLEESQGIFSIIRALEVTYAENVGDAAGRLLTNANLNEEIVIPEALVDILAKTWLENFNTGLIKDEIKRNRYKLLEINHFLDIQREEFEELTADNTIVLDADELEI
ncbi:hypothetical protein NQ314_020300 [Rhamnusium bicolor]|uniref:Dynein axonemal assembly factor 1 homolog n=1 Tax=Rhamnusium bicolor TaxID=1586634 RepID=A0AAV8WKH2_9CUCU|nr:hypothetical protein NQ314_020300 [Rhamnusium bicolor]